MSKGDNNRTAPRMVLWYVVLCLRLAMIKYFTPNNQGGYCPGSDRIVEVSAVGSTASPSTPWK